MREVREVPEPSPIAQGRKNQPGEEKALSVGRKEKPRRTDNLDSVTRRKMNNCVKCP